MIIVIGRSAYLAHDLHRVPLALLTGEFVAVPGGYRRGVFVAHESAVYHFPERIRLLGVAVAELVVEHPLILTLVIDRERVGYRLNVVGVRHAAPLDRDVFLFLYVVAQKEELFVSGRQSVVVRVVLAVRTRAFLGVIERTLHETKRELVARFEKRLIVGKVVALTVEKILVVDNAPVARVVRHGVVSRAIAVLYAVIRLLFGGHFVLYALGFAVLGKRIRDRFGYVEHSAVPDEFVVVRALDEVHFFAGFGNVVPERVAVVRILVGFDNDLNAFLPLFENVLGVLCFETRFRRFQPFRAETAVKVIDVQLRTGGIDVFFFAAVR